MVIVDATLMPLLAKVLGQLPHGRARGRRRPGRPVGPRGHRGATVHAYEDLLAGQPDEFDWAEVDESDAAAMCYTSGTTGNPKGVAYSHRSIYLHSMQVCMADGFGARPAATGCCSIVPMFHAMAWGTAVRGVDVRRVAGHAGPVPARRAAGRDDRAGEADARRRACRRSGPALLAYLDQTPRDMSSLREVDRRRLGLPAAR